MNEIVEDVRVVEIEKLVYGGDGLGRLDGQVVFIPFVLPGEQTEAKITKAKGDLLRAKNINVLRHAEQRIQPACEYFTDCGGCHYQHATYDFQVQQKAAILIETLRRVGQIELDVDVKTKQAEPWAYRNRIQLHFQNRKLGFRKADSHDLCEITHCPISSPMLNHVIEVLGKSAKKSEWPDFLQSLEIFTDEQQIQLTVLSSTRPVAARFFDWMKDLLPTSVPGALEYKAAGHTFQISRGSFFQVNRFLTDALVEEVITGAAGDKAVDLYSGAGLFSLPIAASFNHVTAVELGGPAFRDLDHNCSRATAEIEAVKAPTENFLSALDEAPDWMFADPPRAGLGRDVTAELLRLKTNRLTLVSCDPATLARDLKVLGAIYRIRKMTLIDLFPQTFHFETVVHLELK